MRSIVLCVLLVAMLLSLGCSSNVVPPVTGSSGLSIQNPPQARASEIVLIKTSDGAGKPLSGVRVYSPDYLGNTANDGGLLTLFKEPGDYQLVARKGEAGKPGFSEAKGVIHIISGPVELQAFDGVAPPMPPGEIYTGDQHYKSGMTVRFSVRNTGNTEIILNNSAPWNIRSAEGDIVLEPIALPSMVSLAPGEHKQWTWDQKDKDDRQISEGGYMVILKCSMGEYGLRFWIIPEGMTP